jgi:hypothetical protein
LQQAPPARLQQVSPVLIAILMDCHPEPGRLVLANGGEARLPDGQGSAVRSSSQQSPPKLEVIATYGGLKLDQAKRLKELERENAKLKRVVAELSLEKQVLKDIAEGNF